MMWRAPMFLALLLLVPLAVAFFVWAFRRRRRALEEFAEPRLLAVISPDRDERRRYWRAGLSIAALASLAIALAGPKWGFQWQEVKREGIDLIVAIDTSRSMLAQDVKPNRIGRAKLAVQDLVKQLQGDRIGLVAFAGSAFVQCPLTLDYMAFLESLRSTDVGIIPRGGTALAEAIKVSLGAFEGRQGKHAALVMITDGEDNEGDVDAAAKEAAERGIKVFTVGIGTPEGELIQIKDKGQSTYVKDRKGQVVKSRLNNESLQNIASTTGGAYLQAQGADFGLDKLYLEHISTMEKRELESTIERRYKEQFQWPLGVALVLLAIESLIGNRKPSGAGLSRFWRARRGTA